MSKNKAKLTFIQSEYYFIFVYLVFAAFVTLHKLYCAYITMYNGQIECFSHNTDNKQDDSVDIRRAEDTGNDDGGGHSHS